MIQDTSFIIDILRGDEDAVAFLDISEKEKRPEKISSVTVLELYEGVARSSTPQKQQQQVLSVLDTKHVVEADAAVMRKAGKLSGQLISQGNQIEREDCVIAATAVLEDEPVVTRNENHFDRINEIEVLTY